MATTHDHEISQYPGAPTAPIKYNKSDADKDAAIDAFLAKLAEDGAAIDPKITEQAARAASAVMSGELKDANLISKLKNAPVAAIPVAPQWNVFRDETVKFLGYTTTTDPVQVAIHYQVDNGFFRVQGSAFVSELQNHINGVLKVPNSNGKPLNPGYFIERVAYLYRCASRAEYNHTMNEVYDAKAVAPTDPALLNEWNLLKEFGQNRAMATTDYLSRFARYDKAVKDFYAAVNGTNNSLPALAFGPQPAAQPPVVVATALSLDQQALAERMDKLKTNAATDLASFTARVVWLKDKQTALGALDEKKEKDLKKIEKAWQEAKDEKDSVLPASILTRMRGIVDKAKNMEAKDPSLLPQTAALEKIYQDTVTLFNTPGTGVQAKVDEANAVLRQLVADARAKAVKGGTALLDRIKRDAEAITQQARKDLADAKTKFDAAEVEFKNLMPEYKSQAKLEAETKRFQGYESDIGQHFDRLASAHSDLEDRHAEFETLKARQPNWWILVNPTNAIDTAINGERRDFDAAFNDVVAYLKEIEKMIVKLGGHIKVERSKPAFRVPAPKPDEYKADERLNQANLWYHMFDSPRLHRTDAYRLDLIKNKKATPWPFNLSNSLLDVYTVLEAAVKTNKSNRVMDLIDKDDFYKAVDNLIVATCVELGGNVAPPQPNTKDEQMFLFVATGASLDLGVQWVYANDSITAYQFQRLANAVKSRVDDKGQIVISGKAAPMPLLTGNRHASQSAKAPKVIQAYEEAY